MGLGLKGTANWTTPGEHHVYHEEQPEPLWSHQSYACSFLANEKTKGASTTGVQRLQSLAHKSESSEWVRKQLVSSKTADDMQKLDAPKSLCRCNNKSMEFPEKGPILRLL